MTLQQVELEELCVEAGKLPDGASRKTFLHRYPELLSTQVVEQLADAVRIAVRVDIQKASNLAEAAIAIARELDHEEAMGRALRAKANATWIMGDCRSAVELFDEAANLFERAGNRNEVGRTLSSSIQSMALLGDYERAFSAADRAREIFTSLGESFRVARLQINVANIYHRQNRYAEALAAYEQAYRELLPHKDMEGIGVALHNMAVCLIVLDDFDGALEAYGRVHTLCEQYDMPLLIAQADYNIAYLHYLRGEYTKSLELLRATREKCRKNGDEYHLGLCDLDQSEIYLELNLAEEAAEMAQRSLEHFQRLGMNYEAARSQMNLAIAVSLQGSGERALDLFAGAREMARHEDNQVLPSLIDLYSALVLFEAQEFACAQELCEEVLNFFQAAPLPSKHVLCRLLLARILLRTSDLAGSFRECDAALQILEKLDAPVLLYQAHFLRGQILEASGKAEEAYRSYQEARSVVETLRSSLQRDELKIGFMRNRLEVYSRLLQLCLNRDSSESSAEEALSYVEAAKSRALQDLTLAGAQPNRADEQEHETDRHVRALRKELNWYYHCLEREQYAAEKVSEIRLEQLRFQAKSRERELLRLLLEAPVSAAVGAALQSSRAATLNEIRKALGPEATLLEYFAIDGQLHAAVLSQESLRILPLGEVPAIAQSVRMLNFQLSKFRLDRAYVERFQAMLLTASQAHLNTLYRHLIAPAEEFLNTADLVIVPYGLLHSLPFHALFDGEQYLVDKFSLCYAPSASIFTRCHSGGKKHTGFSLILGIDDPAMPFIRDEVDAVATVVADPKVLWGAEATETALSKYGPDSQLIHIASHGFFKPDSPMFSAIRLADSYLSLYDLYRMNLPVEHLTLSGCVTGLDHVDKGDELIGLTRGLLCAGARSLLLSLWDVDDRGTAEFMQEFYRGLGNGSRKADAIRAAMFHLRKKCPHPYYWAAFKLIGRALA